jgi:hypothetical protein
VLVLLIGAGPAFSPEPGAASSPTADYLVVFDATWSDTTHPGTLPPSPHFSGLIGALHNDQVTFWELGGIATEGIERMAEAGSKSRLTDEVEAAIGLGTARKVLSGGGINPSPDTEDISFTATQAYPLMTLVSMLAPSPDWFVGVDSLPLHDGNDWEDEIIVPLYVYDSGTDSGTTFTSSNQDTSPPDPITVFDTGVFAPPMQFVGTFTITRTDTPPPPPVPGLDGIIPMAALMLTLGAFGAREARLRSSPVRLRSRILG